MIEFDCETILREAAASQEDMDTFIAELDTDQRAIVDFCVAAGLQYAINHMSEIIDNADNTNN